jgi:hypothetical protein
LEELRPLMFLSFNAQLECFFFVWKIVVGFGCQLFVVELVYLLGRC